MAKKAEVLLSKQVLCQENVHEIHSYVQQGESHTPSTQRCSMYCFALPRGPLPVTIASLLVLGILSSKHRTAVYRHTAQKTHGSKAVTVSATHASYFCGLFASKNVPNERFIGICGSLHLECL